MQKSGLRGWCKLQQCFTKLNLCRKHVFYLQKLHLSTDLKCFLRIKQNVPKCILSSALYMLYIMYPITLMKQLQKTSKLCDIAVANTKLVALAHSTDTDQASSASTQKAQSKGFCTIHGKHELLVCVLVPGIAIATSAFVFAWIISHIATPAMAYLEVAQRI